MHACACIHNGILLSHKKSETMPCAATSMDLEVITLSELNQMEKDKYHDITYMQNLKNLKNLFTKQKQDSLTRKQTYGCQRRNGLGEG